MKTTARIGLVLASLAIVLVGAGCSPGLRTTTGGPAPATTTGGATSAAPTQALPDPTLAEPSPAITPPAPTQASVVTPPVAIAIITAFTASSVSWTDGELVGAQANNVTVEALAGAAHQHSAPLSPNIRYYTFQGPDGLLLDDNGNGTVPCDRQAEAALVIDNQELSPRLTFDSQGRVLTMAARFHP